MTADYQVHPELTAPGLAMDQARNGRLGHIKYLRHAPKRRACPAWGVTSEALLMAIERKTYSHALLKPKHNGARGIEGKMLLRCDDAFAM
eukprot:4277951-Pyramimonas_sp.AAC.1